MGRVTAVCTSARKGTAKKNVGRALLIENHGLENDAHAGPWHRQVSLLSQEKIEAFKARGALVVYGCFGENLVVDGIDFASLPVGTRLEVGDCLLEMTQIGKECHDKCQIYHSMGECIMPSQGVFARVLKGGEVVCGDEMRVLEAADDGGRRASAGDGAQAEKAADDNRARMQGGASRAHRVFVITVSDKAHAGLRADAGGPAAEAAVTGAGFALAGRSLLPDDETRISEEIIRIADQGLAELILTTGGTGFSPKDLTPEATLKAVTRLCPGIPEAMRAASMAKTRRAMLSRAVCGIRGQSLVVNLPGSPAAVSECLEAILEEIGHGLDVLGGKISECAGHKHDQGQERKK